MVQPVPGSGFYRVFADFCGFLILDFSQNPNQIFSGSPDLPVQLRIRVGFQNTASFRYSDQRLNKTVVRKLFCLIGL